MRLLTGGQRMRRCYQENAPSQASYELNGLYMGSC